jgi:FkbM family methyltransferase
MKTVHGWAYPDADEFMAGEMKADGTYQYSHLTRALAYVQDWALALDGGAHVGTWSRLLAAKFGVVVACEPSTDTYEALQANMAAFACTNVALHNVALGDRKGRVQMRMDGRGAQLKNTGSRYVLPGGETHQVTIDSLNLPACGFLKLDVEGSEPAALAGATETLARHRPIVLFEDKNLWRRFGARRDAPQGLLLQAGYKHLERAGCDEIWGPA